MYHWWIYEYVVNTAWFVQGFAWALFLFNFTLPGIVWFTMSSRNPLRREKNDTGAGQPTAQDEDNAWNGGNAKNPPEGGSSAGSESS
ncbi:hypothetical protein BCM02_101678 [Paenibacillus methanolicus]|uniref:Uncharacterized protein n=2 Tax=Paenibacillus methanolicus TaxID=582686 RepID=A0A5S5CME9_9BACL|nr:hypothetical protein BCM02_101678 [Paenibacillus methanolicus]